MNADVAPIGEFDSSDELWWFGVFAEALPLIVACVGGFLYTVDLSAIGMDQYLNRLFVVLVFAPLFFPSGIGWVITGRVPVGAAVFLLRATVFGVTFYQWAPLLNPEGSLITKHVGSMLAFFYIWLGVSLLIAAVSTALLAASEWNRRHRIGD